MPEHQSRVWERLNDDSVQGPTLAPVQIKSVTERMAVPGGFLYRTIVGTAEGMTAPLGQQSTGRTVSVSMVFVPTVPTP
jgi:hypothetical protein